MQIICICFRIVKLIPCPLARDLKMSVLSQDVDSLSDTHGVTILHPGFYHSYSTARWLHLALSNAPFFVTSRS